VTEFGGRNMARRRRKRNVVKIGKYTAKYDKMANEWCVELRKISSFDEFAELFTEDVVDAFQDVAEMMYATTKKLRTWYLYPRWRGELVASSEDRSLVWRIAQGLMIRGLWVSLSYDLDTVYARDTEDAGKRWFPRWFLNAVRDVPFDTIVVLGITLETPESSRTVDFFFAREEGEVRVYLAATSIRHLRRILSALG